MKELKIIEHNGARVLTTSQLAESYGATSEKISYNFNYNKSRYQEGKHFIALTGDEKRSFINRHEIQDGSKKAQTLYLWTEKGAWLHAKSLNTDQAWEVYEMLVDEYYRIKESTVNVHQLSPELQMFNKLFNTLAQQELEQKQLKAEVEQTKSEVNGIREIVALNTRNWRKDVNSILNNIAIKLGGYEQYKHIRNESYDLLEQRANCKLSIRVINKQKKMALEGVAKSKVDKVSKLDAIDDDKRLLEIYLAVVKEMAIKYRVDIPQTVEGTA
ncbi:ORF6N domain-containing protein [Sutcliffiella cohnii]